MKQKEVAVIGAGITGLQAAIELADSGVKVNLIEKKSAAGGNASDLYKAFPTDDCFFCIGSTNKKKGIRKCFYRSGIVEHPNINLILNAEINDLTVRDKKISIDMKLLPQYIDHEKCVQCGKCEETCPVILKKDSNPLKNEHKKPIFHRIQCLPYSYYISRDLCKEGCGECEKACPVDEVINLKAESKEQKLEVDSVILALGYREFKPIEIKNYHYEDYANVITQMELARMLDPTGPTKGKLIRLNDKKLASNVLMLQCVGSRDVNYQPYCSSTCCSFACKHATIIKSERNPDAEVWLTYRDVRTLGTNEKIYSTMRKTGVNIVKGEISKIFEEQDGSITVHLYDLILNQIIKLNVDLFVLSCALIPGEYSNKISKMAKVKLNEFGFLENQNDLVQSLENGIFVTSSMIKPVTINESTTLARASAFKVLKYLNEVQP